MRKLGRIEKSAIVAVDDLVVEELMKQVLGDRFGRGDRIGEEEVLAGRLCFARF
jgi:hypothetical protein